MTKKETLQILAILKAAYPSSYNGMTKEELSGTVAVWMIQFADMPADIVLMALQKHISTNKFPPSIAEIKEKLRNIRYEAEREMSKCYGEEPFPQETYDKFSRIFNHTYDYSGFRLSEPKISQLMLQNHQLQLGSGSDG